MRRSQLLVAVQEKFVSLPRAGQRLVRQSAQFDHDVGFWQRCRVILNLVRGHRPCDIQRHLLCSPSTVTRVARAFLADGLSGHEDGRASEWRPEDSRGGRRCFDAVRERFTSGLLLGPADMDSGTVCTDAEEADWNRCQHYDGESNARQVADST